VTNRTRGDYLERQTKAALVDLGWLVTRSAGSMGIADLVALRKGSTPLLVSCKVGGRIDPGERAELCAAAEAAGARAILAQRRRRGWVRLDVVRRDRSAMTPLDEIPVPGRAMLHD
jgi:Holliday junction resolvase